MVMMYVLVIGDDTPSLCDSLKTAKAYFREVAEELAQYEQRIEASVHCGGWDTYQEYPDYVLSLGPKGGLICERC